MVTEIQHPCVRHKMALLRDEATGPKKFRELVTEITMFVGYEALKHVGLEDIRVKTPLAEMTGQRIAHDIVVVPILRAGVGMLDGILGLVPTARVGYLGLYRDSETKKAIEYYKRLPKVADEALYIVIDPMLATGGSTNATLDALRDHGVQNIVVACIVTCPEGIQAVEAAHPDVPVYAAVVDEHLDGHKYIVPGLGDAGDRLYGTS